MDFLGGIAGSALQLVSPNDVSLFSDTNAPVEMVDEPFCPIEESLGDLDVVRLALEEDKDSVQIIQHPVTCIMCYLPRFVGSHGKLTITSYHVVFASETTGIIRIPLLGISTRFYESSDGSGKSILEILPWDSRWVKFQLDTGVLEGQELSKPAFSLLSWAWSNRVSSLESVSNACVNTVPFSKLFHCTGAQLDSDEPKAPEAAVREKSHVPSKVYDIRAEARRMGVDDSMWRISEVNTEYELCKSYPPLIIVPKSITDNDLVKSAEFRARGRIPVLSWLHPIHKSALMRASQPKTGIMRSRSIEDELLLHEAFHANPHHINGTIHYVVDARPQVNAMASAVATGGGFENSDLYPELRVHFLDIPNIHIVRESFTKLRTCCIVVDHPGWRKAVEMSGWLQHIQALLRAAQMIVKALDIEKKTVLVHCTDGWDRTSQLVGLSQVLIDPHVRTREGFAMLIEKEFVAFGHKFRDRLCESVEASPIFLQWLDCVWQIMNQYPSAFEFNELYLISLADLYLSGQYGNFLYNTYYDLVNSSGATSSVWLYLDHDRFSNGEYSASEKTLCIRATERHIELWKSYFLRWDTSFWNSRK